MFKSKIELFVFGAIVFSGGIIAGVHLLYNSNNVDSALLSASLPISSSKAVSVNNEYKKPNYSGVNSLAEYFGRDLSKIYSNVGPGSENDLVKNVQSRLFNIGLLKVEPTGYFGKSTEGAISDFQKKFELPQTGLMDRNTVVTLFTSTSDVPYEEVQTSNPDATIVNCYDGFIVRDNGVWQCTFRQTINTTTREIIKSEGGCYRILTTHDSAIGVGDEGPQIFCKPGDIYYPVG